MYLSGCIFLWGDGIIAPDRVSFYGICFKTKRDCESASGGRFIHRLAPDKAGRFALRESLRPLPTLPKKVSVPVMFYCRCGDGKLRMIGVIKTERVLQLMNILHSFRVAILFFHAR